MKSLNVAMTIAAMALAFGADRAAAQDGRGIPLRFDGGIGVLPIASVSGPQNADGSFPNVTSNTVRGVAPSGNPWRIADLTAIVHADGRIVVNGRGLVLAASSRITQSLQLPVFATLSCQQTGTFDVHSTKSDVNDPTIPRLDANGDFRIDDVLDSAPADCASPLLIIRAAANGTWLAVGIPVRE